MSKGKYSKKHSFSIRPIVLLLTVALLIGGTIGGTIAWLTATTQDVTNTFTVGNIEIELTETFNKDSDNDDKPDIWQGKMIPGWTLDKDPIVTVKAGSEDCWVFIKVTEEDGKYKFNGTETTIDFDSLIAYKIDEKVNNSGNWTKLENAEGVYYCKATDIAADRQIKVLAGGTLAENGVEYTWNLNQVLVKPSVTKDMMDNLSTDGATLPKLTFTAYAVQLYKSNSVEFQVEEAWAQASAASNS